MYGSDVVKIITFLPGAWRVRNARKIHTCSQSKCEGVFGYPRIVTPLQPYIILPLPLCCP